MKTTFRIVLISIILGSAAITTFAQHHRGSESNMEKFKSMKISYLTEKLELTPAEAEKFWPVYNGHEEARNELSQKRRMRSRELASQETSISEKEAEAIIDQHMQLKQEALQLDVKFHNQLKNMLGPKKVMQLYIAETQFREEMLKKIRDERGEGGGKGKKDNP